MFSGISVSGSLHVLQWLDTSPPATCVYTSPSRIQFHSFIQGVCLHSVIQSVSLSKVFDPEKSRHDPRRVSFRSISGSFPAC